MSLKKNNLRKKV